MTQLKISQLKLSQTIALSLGVLAMVFLISIVVLAWTEPSQIPPGSNVPAPINIGGTTQTKEGAIGANGGFFVDGHEMVGSNADKLYANRKNTSGGGIWISDDGGFYDYNNAYIDFRGSTGIRVLESDGSWGDNSIRATYLCMQNDCRSSWPSGGDITGVYAGTNLTGGGSSGEVTLSTVMNPTFNDVYVNNWFRNNQAGEGLYNQATGDYFYSQDANYWRMRSDRGLLVDNRGGTRQGYLYHNNAGSFGLLSPAGSWRVRVDNSNTELYGGVYMPTAYANILYDRNNTGYYVDPASTSRMNEIQANRVYGFADIRSPIFYDYNNTGYYIDPASTSRMNKIRANSYNLCYCIKGGPYDSISEHCARLGAYTAAVTGGDLTRVKIKIYVCD